MVDVVNIDCGYKSYVYDSFAFRPVTANCSKRQQEELLMDVHVDIRRFLGIMKLVFTFKSLKVYLFQ